MMLKEREVLMQVSRLSAARLHLCIQEAWITPATDQAGPAFDDLDVARLQLIADLTEDMAVNDDAVPVILSLVDQLNTTRRHLRALDRAITDQDETTRQQIIARLRDLLDTP